MRFSSGRWIVLILAFASFARGSDTESRSCRDDPRVVSACYTVHGHIANWNGNPARRISVIGTRRILGLRDEAPMPKVLEDTLTSFDVAVYGDFEFCPFTAQKQGVMRVGCVAKVSSYQIKQRQH